jgi:hypothetical protein
VVAIPPRKTYRGSKQVTQVKTSEHNRIAAELERYINARIEERAEEIQVYLYYEIASATGYPLKLVREMLFGVDGGHNGFTVVKRAGGEEG